MQEKQKKIHVFALNANVTLKVLRLDAKEQMLYPFLGIFSSEIQCPTLLARR